MPVRKLEQSLMVPLPGGDQLHIRRLADNPDGPPVMLLHGLLEDGTLFYSRDGRGLAHYLAQQGFDVFVPDFRGKGRSWPPVSRWSSYRVNDAVTQDMPAILDAIQGVRGLLPVYWFAHAWGGVLVSSFLARYPGYRTSINGLIYFGTHRVATRHTLSRLVWVDALWGWVGGLFARLRGYLPGRLLRFGSNNEFHGIPLDSFGWLQGQPWVDPGDQFDYGKALSEGLDYPPALYFASRQDLGYCNPREVKAFMAEVGAHNGRLVILGEKEGNLHNYSHIGMLTHPDATRDHFAFMVNWMQEMSRLRYEAMHGDDSRDSGTHRSSARGN